MEFIKISRLDDVLLYSFNKFSTGQICLTTTHLIFVESSTGQETWINYHLISVIEKLPLSTRGSPIRFKCKNFRILFIVISREKDCNIFLETIRYFSSPLLIDNLCCFLYTLSDNINSKYPIQSKMFNLQSEYSRMGLPDNFWSISYLNANFELCDTYPSVLIFPKSVCSSRNLIFESAKFRSKQRLPTLCYYNSNTNTSICRSSQPLRFISKRSACDEELIRCIFNTNPKGKYMYVLDLRPAINALAQRAAGKGYEDIDVYPNVKFQFFGLQNIHVIRDNLNKLLDILNKSEYNFTDYFQNIANCEWFKNMRILLEGSIFVARSFCKESVNILIHCSDGWDRTTQVSSLSQLFIDSYYRTIQGFISLIEKEWLSFGHKFTSRCGHIKCDPKDISPIFIQFLDAVYQSITQYTTHFEFNEHFLLTLANEVYTCNYGTFICESDKEREDLNLKLRTKSLWDNILKNIHLYKNPLFTTSFSRSCDGLIYFIEPKIELKHLKLWSHLYCQFNLSKLSLQNINESLSSIYLQNDVLFKYCNYLTDIIDNDPLDSIVDNSTNFKFIQNKNKDNFVRYLILLYKDCHNNKLRYEELITKHKILHTGNLSVDLQNLLKIFYISPELEMTNYDTTKLCKCQNVPYHYNNQRIYCPLCGQYYCHQCISKVINLPYNITNTIFVCGHCEKLNFITN